MTTPAPFHQLPSARQFLLPQTSLPRHRHVEPCAAVVIEGSYEEAGEQGRRSLMPGDVALHDGFSAHLNRVGKQGVRLVNLPLVNVGERFARVHDLDRLVRLAAVDRLAALHDLQAQLQPLPPTLQDWPDLLARDLSLTPGLLLTDWARVHGLAPETVSRSFARVFGATPRRWRFELRTRNALRAVLHGRQSLVGAALESGFADQAHLTHAVVAMTGRPPGHWRRHVKSRQDM
jgi:AraC-like DNA-binding protein